MSGLGSEVVSLGEVIAGGFMRTPERNPVTRTGPRDGIPRHVRSAVWYRDGGRCAHCPGLEAQPQDLPLHLDHIVPWSAGGSDNSHNLRLLCEPHNIERSNYVDHAGPKRPVTWWCHRCYDVDGPGWKYYENGTVECPRHGWTTGTDGLSRCRVKRYYDRVVQAGEPIDWWHMRDALQTFHITAYCAHCNQPGQTGITL